MRTIIYFFTILISFSFKIKAQEAPFKKNEFEFRISDLVIGKYVKNYNFDFAYTRYLNSKLALRTSFGSQGTLYEKSYKINLENAGFNLNKEFQLNYGLGFKYHFKSPDKGLYAIANFKSSGEEITKNLRYQLGLGYKIPLGKNFNFNIEVGLEKGHMINKQVKLSLLGIGMGYKF